MKLIKNESGILKQSILDENDIELKSNKVDVLSNKSSIQFPTTRAVLTALEGITAGEGVPFEVIPWNPYLEDNVDYSFIPSSNVSIIVDNNNQDYINYGNKINFNLENKQPLLFSDYDLSSILGPDRGGIDIINGAIDGQDLIETKLVLTPSEVDPQDSNTSKGFCIDNFSSLVVTPISLEDDHTGFSNNTNSGIAFLIFQVDSSINPEDVNILDYLGNQNTPIISAMFTNIYLSNYNESSKFNVIGGLQNNPVINTGDIYPYGNYEKCSIKIEGDSLQTSDGK